MDTGFPDQDARTDFGRARRSRRVAGLARRLRREPDDVNLILPFEEVVAALGRRGERRLGLQTIDLDSIVGTVDRTREFDRSFRPTSRRLRQRWERIAKAMRRGEAMPPIDVFRVGELHFVEDGHHRVSVARQLGLEVIEASVTEIVTEIPAGRETRLADLALKGHERLFFERVPLPPADRARIQLSDEWRYAELAEGVEAWGFRLMQARGEYLNREQVSHIWFEQEYVPIVEVLREADLIGDGSETEAYDRVIALRYMLLRTHAWDEDVFARLREAIRHPPASDDTLVHRLLGELPRSTRP
ncbi:MAG: chromosome partitioning protein ParB [Solirubrobacterales bacterium]|nr:chromosome partitioning protein ParB [Solirubrobacterales bacterium]